VIRRVRPFVVRGNGIVGDPSAVSWSDGRIDVVALAFDGGLRHFALADGAWSERRPLPSPVPLIGHPCLTTWGADRLDVFVRDAEQGVQHTWFDGRWQEWTSVAPDARRAAADPVATSWGTGRSDLFVPTAGGAVDHYWYSQEVGFQGPEDCGGDFAGRPDVANTSIYAIHLVARGARDGLVRYQCWLPAERSHSWTHAPPLPGRGVFYISPTVTASGTDLTCTGEPVFLYCRGSGRAANRLLVYARQGESLVCLEPWGWPDTPQPQTPHDRLVGASVASDAAVVSPARCRADVFVGRIDGTVGHLVEDLSGAGIPTRLWEVLDGVYGKIVGRPAVVVSRTGQLDLFFRGVDGELCHGWWDASTDEWNTQ
jgi:hypothetical protein